MKAGHGYGIVFERVWSLLETARLSVLLNGRKNRSRVCHVGSRARNLAAASRFLHHGHKTMLKRVHPILCSCRASSYDTRRKKKYRYVQAKIDQLRHRLRYFGSYMPRSREWVKTPFKAKGTAQDRKVDLVLQCGLRTEPEQTSASNFAL